MTAIMLDERRDLRPPSETGARIPAGETAGGIAELHIRQLGANDLPAVERHLLALGPADRRARFLTYGPDKMIAAYVRRIDPSSTVLVGAFDQSGRMVGLAEAHPAEPPDAVEIAVSIDLAFRRRGLGHGLVARALALVCPRRAVGRIHLCSR
jgi:hypothetical protein